MKKIIIIFIFFFNPIGPQIQVNLDSLIRSIETKEDTATVNLLLKIVGIQSNIDPSKSPQFINETLQLSKHRNYIKGKANANFHFGRCCFLRGNMMEELSIAVKV